MNKQDSPTNKKQNRTWTSRSLAPEFFHRLFYAAIRLTGRQTAYFMLFFVVSFYTLLPGVRKRASHYIARRFGCTTPARCFVHTFRLYWNFGQMLVDRSVLRILGKFKAVGKDVDTSKLKELYSEQQRLILLTGHVGCWQMGISYLDFLDAPKAVVMLMDSEDVDRHSFKWQPSGNSDGEKCPEKITVINPAAPMGGTLEMLSALKNNSVLCINADRTFGSSKNTVEVEFLGGRIKLPISAYKIAAATDTPIAIAFSERTGPGEGIFWTSGILRVPRNTGKGDSRGPEAFTHYAQAFARELEKYCQAHPYQFYNFFNMWH